jgi:hypothetical protein
MTHTIALKHAFEFPEGRFLISNDGGAYFLPDMHKTAYLAWGERKELLGKIAHILPTRADFKKYELTYEFEDGALLAARLISPKGKSKGVCVAKDVFNDLAAALQTGALEVASKKEPARIVRAARLMDGRTLLMLENMPGEDFRTLRIGKPGAFEKLPTKTYIQGGAHFIFTLADGGRVDLPSGLTGPGANDFPTYNDDPMTYLDHRKLDLKQLGIDVEALAPHLDPFCPELDKPAPQPQWKPKGPQA